MRRAYTALEVALLRISKYPRSRDEELSIDGARAIAMAALAYAQKCQAEDQRRRCEDGCNGCEDCTDYEG